MAKITIDSILDGDPALDAGSDNQITINAGGWTGGAITGGTLDDTFNINADLIDFTTTLDLTTGGDDTVSINGDFFLGDINFGNGDNTLEINGRLDSGTNTFAFGSGSNELDVSVDSFDADIDVTFGGDLDVKAELNYTELRIDSTATGSQTISVDASVTDRSFLYIEKTAAGDVEFKGTATNDSTLYIQNNFSGTGVSNFDIDVSIDAGSEFSLYGNSIVANESGEFTGKFVATNDSNIYLFMDHGSGTMDIDISADIHSDSHFALYSSSTGTATENIDLNLDISGGGYATLYFDGANSAVQNVDVSLNISSVGGASWLYMSAGDGEHSVKANANMYTDSYLYFGNDATATDTDVSVSVKAGDVAEILIANDDGTGTMSGKAVALTGGTVDLVSYADGDINLTLTGKGPAATVISRHYGTGNEDITGKVSDNAWLYVTSTQTATVTVNASAKNAWMGINVEAGSDDITAKLTGYNTYTAFIYTGADDDVIDVTAKDSGDLTIDGEGGNDTISVNASGLYDINVYGGSGDDTFDIVLNGVYNADVNGGSGTGVNTGTLDASNGSGVDLNLDAGNSTDTWTVELSDDSWLDVNADAGDSVTVDLDGSNNEVYFAQTTGTGSLTINGEIGYLSATGSVTITVNDEQDGAFIALSGSTTLNFSDDDDYLILTTITGSSTVDFGDGDNTVVVRDGLGNSTLVGGTGTDIVIAVGQSSVTGSNTLTDIDMAYILGDSTSANFDVSGSDGIDLTFGNADDTITITGSVTLDIDLRDGNDTLSISDALTGGNLDGGAGTTDTLDLDANISSTTLISNFEYIDLDTATTISAFSITDDVTIGGDNGNTISGLSTATWGLVTGAGTATLTNASTGQVITATNTSTGTLTAAGVFTF